MKSWIIIALALTSATAFGAATRTLDGQQITNGAATLTLPSSTDTLVGRATTDTLTNKSLTAPAVTGAATVQDAAAVVGSSDATKKLQFSLSGMTTGKTLTFSVAQSTSQTLSFPNISGADTVATLGATQTFGSGSTWNGVTIGSAYGGTGVASPTAHGVLIGEGSSPVTPVSGSSAGQVLTWNSSGDPSFQAPTSAAPSLNGGSGSAESVTAGGGISLSSIAYSNFVWVAGSSGAVTVTKTPSVTVGTADGQRLNIVGTSATNTVTLQDQANLASSGLSLNGNWVGGKDSVLALHWDATQSLWVEDARR